MTDQPAPPWVAPDDHEQLLRLLADIQSLIRTDSVDDQAKLRAIHQAATEAIGGSPEKARDFVQQVALGLMED